MSTEQRGCKQEPGANWGFYNNDAWSSSALRVLLLELQRQPLWNTKNKLELDYVTKACACRVAALPCWTARHVAVQRASGACYAATMAIPSLRWRRLAPKVPKSRLSANIACQGIRAASGALGKLMLTPINKPLFIYKYGGVSLQSDKSSQPGWHPHINKQGFKTIRGQH